MSRDRDYSSVTDTPDLAQRAADMYKEVVRLALHEKNTMYFNDAEWNDTDVAAFVPTLRLCPKLSSLKLRSNQIGDAGVESLAGAIKEGCLSALKTLWLGDNPFGVGGLKALGDAASHNLKSRWNGRYQNGRLQSLKLLDFDGCRFEDNVDAFDAFFDGLTKPGALMSLETLSLRGTPAGAKLRTVLPVATPEKGIAWNHPPIDRARARCALLSLRVENIRCAPRQDEGSHEQDASNHGPKR